MRRVAMFAVAVAALWAAGSAHATHVSCGQTITTDTTLDSDLECSGRMVIGADDVEFDLNGHTLDGVVLAAEGRHDISVRNGNLLGVTGGTAIDFQRVTRGHVLDMRIEGAVRFGDRPTANVLADSDVYGLVWISEDGWTGDQLFRPADNRIEGNTTRGIAIRLSDRNVVRDNDVIGAPLTVVGETSFVGPEDNGADENWIVGNRVREVPRLFRGYSMLLVQDCRRNLVEDNEISGGPTGIWVSVSCADNVLRNNLVDGASPDGILIGDPPYEAARTLVEGNNVSDSSADGIAVRSSASDSFLRNNVAFGNGDDGIDIADITGTVESNRAYENGDWGIVAVPGIVDGGGNRAWSNGQSAQCLNVACGSGPPASLSLSPQSATNTVGDKHCVTAAVADPDGRATPGVVVRFAVDAGEEGAVESDATGRSEFCYDGPLAPRTDAITAYADDDADGVQDPGEPGDSASKSWVVPGSSERCRVRGNGAIVAANGDAASFRVNVQVHKARSRGSLFYEDQGPADAVVLRSSRMSSLTCSGSNASVFGRTHGSSSLYFRIDVVDSGSSGDRYRIRVSNGYDSGDRVVTGGNIWVQ